MCQHAGLLRKPAGSRLYLFSTESSVTGGVCVSVCVCLCLCVFFPTLNKRDFLGVDVTHYSHFLRGGGKCPLAQKPKTALFIIPIYSTFSHCVNSSELHHLFELV